MNSEASTSTVTSPDAFLITRDRLSLDKVYHLAENPASGAIVLMSGTVRDRTDGRTVQFLDYQAYEPMALQVFKQIAADLRNQWPSCQRIIIHHRTGRLYIGDISVLIAVSCPHRDDAFSACRYAIDTLKYNVPIWKKEHWADGSSHWVTGM
ncbi:MAG: molybdenum cofactor biosynthesis protein MoaE [Jaaginema sp. PMC 1079.18]|nr:molybdenum cofactor biosynthesis protein MoaE [Jaaginema sp. PMC 1080.18]MEC4851104.1 molybdenum cofactor biosynthesis protein MoaE [Jaaginema sp. PMC 1079.18]MEC4868141.1 molybdenum cofactor biosynthesis protein MoaE [Jaaginema sp. PMC 1078.18]